MRRIFEEETRSKSIPITKQMVWKAYQAVKRNQGSAGVDQISLSDYEQDLPNRLYKLWNRLSSGSYFPSAVLEVGIPKSTGKVRKLGIPTVEDRIAQQVIKDYLEPRLEAVFHENSYGYRPNRSAHDALAAVRVNVRKYSWVVDMDIAGFFDAIDHGLLLKALAVHVEEKWVLLYVTRWLQAPVETSEGLRHKQGLGTPQGGVISPLLANLYLHYCFDKWISIHFKIAFVRYADDIILHAVSEKQAVYLLSKIEQRFKECGLTLNEKKTKIVYCQNYHRSDKKTCKSFDFLGFSFRPRAAKSKKFSKLFVVFDCAISRKSISRILTGWRQLRFHSWTKAEITELAQLLNRQVRGIIHYYGKYRKWELEKLFRKLHHRLAKWVMNKYMKGSRGSYKKALRWLRNIQRRYPTLFYHWTVGYKIT